MVEQAPISPDLIKFIGSLMGSIAALIYFRPRNIRDAMGRFVFSMIVGYLMYFIPIEVMRAWVNFDAVEYRDLIAGGSMFAALVSWPIAGVFIKYASRKAEE